MPVQRWGPLAIAALAAVLLTGLVAVTNPAGSCQRLVVTVASSEEKAGLLQQIAAGFNGTHPTVGSECLAVQVERVASGTAEHALATGWNPAADGEPPDVWSPAAVTWILLLDQELSDKHAAAMAPADSPSLFRSPLVIAMPRPMAQAIQAAGKPVGWSDLFQLAGDPAGWDRYGRPELGPFQLAKTNPLVSTSGLHALIGAYFAASGRSSNLTADVLTDPTVVNYVRSVERSVVHYGDSVSNFLINLQAADDDQRALTYISAIAMEEKEVWDYNQGNPKGDPATLGKHPPPTVPLVAIYPKEGTLAADHPYAILNAPWVTTSKRTGAQQFLAYLQSRAVQSRFQAAGFRDQRGMPGAVISPANGMQPDLPGAYLQVPSGAVVQAVQRSWSALRKRARVLLLIDCSALANGLSAARLADSVKTGLRQLAGDDEVGAWAIPTPTAPQPYIDVEPIAPLQSQAGSLPNAIAGLHPATAPIKLYLALDAAADTMAAQADPARVNAVVLISPERSTDPGDTDRFIALAHLSDVASRNPGVHVFTIRVGASAAAAVDPIAARGKGAAYNAADLNSVGRALAAVISNF